jgi:hypothetical protein
MIFSLFESWKSGAFNGLFDFAELYKNTELQIDLTRRRVRKMKFLCSVIGRLFLGTYVLYPISKHVLWAV